MTIRAIASDLDGTLLLPNHTLGTYTCDTIRRAHQQGLHILLASGRAWPDVEQIRQELQIPMQVITSNGARVHNHQGELTFRMDIEPATVDRLLALPTAEGLHLNLYIDDDWWVERPNPYLLTMHKHSGFAYQVAPRAQISRQGVAKLFYQGSHEQLLQWQQLLRSQFSRDEVNIAFSLPTILEVMAPAVSKGAALHRVVAELGISVDEVMAFGDGLNDLEMLQEAGHPRLMANAIAGLKEAFAPEFLIGSNAEEGVAQEIDRLVKNRAISRT